MCHATITVQLPIRELSEPSSTTLSCFPPTHLCPLYIFLLYMRPGHALLARVDDKQDIQQPVTSDTLISPRSSSVNTHTFSHTSRFRPRNMLLTPRSSNYERLEGGLGPSRMSTRRFGWKKFAIGAVVLIGLVYIVGPRKHNLIPNKYIPCESIRFSWHLNALNAGFPVFLMSNSHP